MSASDEKTSRLERAFASVYGGPLEDFVARRDSLAKQLRSDGDRDSASTVKGLRKPSRMAWALDLGALDAQHALEALGAAVAGTLEAQAVGGDVRAAITSLRAAVREFASQAARAAEQAGHRIEPGVLVNAVLAVIGTPESFDQLRGGYLASVPEAGGLDFLAALPAPPGSLPARAEPRAPAAAHSSSSQQAERGAAAREAARQAARVRHDARIRSEDARQALREAESELQAAEARLRQAEDEARAAHSQCDRARQDAEAAAARLLELESAAL